MNRTPYDSAVQELRALEDRLTAGVSTARALAYIKARRAEIADELARKKLGQIGDFLAESRKIDYAIAQTRAALAELQQETSSTWLEASA
ncbi:MAG TPA: hypothetical protein VF593_07040 [Chthoniobacteraceae bacterium]|jgi:hypothetical protein